MRWTALHRLLSLDHIGLHDWLLVGWWGVGVAVLTVAVMTLVQ